MKEKQNCSEEEVHVLLDGVTPRKSEPRSVALARLLVSGEAEPELAQTHTGQITNGEKRERMTNQPTIQSRSAQPFVAIKTAVSMDQLGTVVPPLTGEVIGWLARGGAAPAGAPFWKYDVVNMPGSLEIQSGVPVARPVNGDERVTAGTLPAGRYVTLRHVGHPDTLAAATGALLEWAAQQGLKFDVTPSPDGERWAARLEIYLTDPSQQPDMNKWQTELAFKLAD